MHAHLDRAITDLMQEHPQLGDVLAQAGIGCTTCSLGTCRVRDILEIHDLDTARIQDLLTAMGRVIHGTAPFEIPVITRQSAAPRNAFCPPIQRMVAEHEFILRAVDQLPRLIQGLHRDPASHLELAANTLAFIQTYADQYHHAKEEDILFGYFEAQSDILGVMAEDHTAGRSHVQAARTALEARDIPAFEVSLQAWGDLLRGHIHREDTILYPWMDRALSTRQVGELFARCAQVEQAFQERVHQQEAFVQHLESTLGA